MVLCYGFLQLVSITVAIRSTYKACKHAAKPQQFLPLLMVVCITLKNNFNCNTKYVIYLICYKKCNIQYVKYLKCIWTKTYQMQSICLWLHTIFLRSIMGMSHFLHLWKLRMSSRQKRGNDHRKKLLSRKTYWIFMFICRSLHSLNIRQDVILHHWCYQSIFIVIFHLGKVNSVSCV